MNYLNLIWHKFLESWVQKKPHLNLSDDIRYSECIGALLALPTLHGFQQLLVPWIRPTKPVRVSSRMASKPPGQLRWYIRHWRDRIRPVAPRFVVFHGKSSSLLPVQFFEVMVVVEKGCDFVVVLCPSDLLQQSVWKESYVGHVDPTQHIPDKSNT